MVSVVYAPRSGRYQYTVVHRAVCREDVFGNRFVTNEIELKIFYVEVNLLLEYHVPR